MVAFEKLGFVGRPANRFRVLFDRSLTPANVLDHAAHWHGRRTLFNLDRELPYQSLPGTGVSPARLLSFVNRVGNILRDNGLKPRDRVAIYKENSPDYFFLALAVIKAGGVAVPINPGMPLEHLRHHVENIGCRMVLTDEARFGAVVQHPSNVPTVECWVFPDVPEGFPREQRAVGLDQAVPKASGRLAPAPLAPDDIVLITHTSGTTGVPKGVLVGSRSLIRAAKGHYVDEPIGKNNRTALAGHFSHLVFYVGFYSSLLGNQPVWTLPEHSPRAVLDFLENERINMFVAFPDVYARMYHHGLDGHELSAMRAWVATGDTSHDKHMHAFCQKGAFLRVAGKPVLRSIFVEAIGSSEVGFLALRRIRFSFSPRRADRLIGRPSPAGPRVKVTDDRGGSVAANAIGRLAVKGPTILRGYRRDGRDVTALNGQGWLYTGDVAYRDRFGRYFHLDRENDVVHTSRGRFFTLPAEETLIGHPDVSDATVVGVCAGDAEEPVAWVIPRPGRVIDPKEFLAWAHRQLPRPVRLHDIFVVEYDELPRGHTGKVLKRVLQERYALEHQSEGDV